jgi:hypothetical protein
MTKPKREDDPRLIFIDLYKPGRFQEYFKGFLGFLQKNLQKREVVGTIKVIPFTPVANPMILGTRIGNRSKY